MIVLKVKYQKLSILCYLLEILMIKHKYIQNIYNK